MYKAITIVFYFILSFKAAVAVNTAPLRSQPPPMKKNPFVVEKIKENNDNNISSEEDNVFYRKFSENLDRLNRLRDLKSTLPVQQPRGNILPRGFNMRAGGMKEYFDNSDDGFLD